MFHAGHHTPRQLVAEVPSSLQHGERRSASVPGKYRIWGILALAADVVEWVETASSLFICSKQLLHLLIQLSCRGKEEGQNW